MKTQLAFNLASRSPVKKMQDSPGPGAYRNEDVKLKQSPMRSFGIRTETRSKQDTPGPGAYTINDSLQKKAAAAFSLKGRPEDSQLKFNSPGPGEYAVGNLIGKKLELKGIAAGFRSLMK